MNYKDQIKSLKKLLNYHDLKNTLTDNVSIENTLTIFSYFTNIKFNFNINKLKDINIIGFNHYNDYLELFNLTFDNKNMINYFIKIISELEIEIERDILKNHLKKSNQVINYNNKINDEKKRNIQRQKDRYKKYQEEYQKKYIKYKIKYLKLKRII